MNLKQIEAFVFVADEKSFSKAASKLYLTQPTVSAHISSLEEELNSALFARTAKGAELTQDGKRMYLYAKQMIELQDMILEQFREGNTESVTHQIIISASTIPAQFLLPDILARYSRMNPNARFSVRETDSAGVIHEITEHMAEIGFTGTLPDKKKCNVYPFYEDELILVTPNTPYYLEKMEAHETPVSFLMDEPMVMRENGSGTRKEAEAYLERAGLSPERLKIVATISSPEAILRSVKSGVGCTLMSKLAAKEAIGQKEVLGFPFEGGGAKRNLYMVVARGSLLSDAAKRLIQVVKNS